jgi:hypothetical protein
MVSRAAPRKRRRLDEDEADNQSEENDETNRHRLPPRAGAPVRIATLVEDEEPAVSVLTPRANSESSNTAAPSSGETIGPAPEVNSNSEARPRYIELPHEETIRSVPRPPLTGYDLDRLNYHVDLRDFGTSLQKAANAVFSSDRRSRYTQVSALLLSWEDEDPQLPVSLEIKELKDVFVNQYGFDVDEWQIPAANSHMELNMKVLQFLKDSSSKHLKIVYYAGHGKLSNHGQAIWTRSVLAITFQYFKPSDLKMKVTEINVETDPLP